MNNSATFFYLFNDCWLFFSKAGYDKMPVHKDNFDINIQIFHGISKGIFISI